MALPLKYNWRSLTARKARTALTALGIGLAVFVALMMLALAEGLSKSIRETGQPLNVLVVSKGAETMEFSAIDRNVVDVLRFSPQVAEAAGERLASPEAYFTTEVQAGSASAQGLVRGVLPVASQVHDQVKLVEGKFPTAPGEIMAGPLAATKLGVSGDAVGLGKKLRFEGTEWTIVGRFSAPGTAFESEIWGPLDDLMVTARRSELSAIVLRAKGQAALDEMLFDFSTRTDVLVDPKKEVDYYAAYAASFRPVQLMVYGMTVMLVAGGIFIGMNTLFAAIIGRVREVGILRTLGFKRRNIVLAFLIESLLPALLGGLGACTLAFTVNGLPLRIPMGAFRFQVDLPLLAMGLMLSALIGFLGAAWPLWRASRIKTVDAIRHL
jgi:putative ABC transport system permease protein